MPKLKTSAAAKANFGRYKTESRKSVNSELKLATHMKKHPNDSQSSKRVKPASAGKTHDKRTQLEASVERMTRTGAFGSPSTRTAVDMKAAKKAAKKAA